jgi:uncharacterized membrane protein YtjA (UPF0391 family)
MKKIVITILVAALILFAASYGLNGIAATNAQIAHLNMMRTLLPGSKNFTVTVVHADGTEKAFSYRTDAEKLGAFLESEGLIESEGADDGMFHTVDGEKADWNVNRSYWAFYLGEDYATEGIYATTIADGAAYKLVYTLG